MSSESLQNADITQPDFALDNHGSVIFLRPLTDLAREWVDVNIGQENGFQPFWPTVLVEPRYVAYICEGIEADGLAVTR